MVEIKKVDSKKSLRQFIQFYYDLYRDCEYAVPYLYFDEIGTLDKKKNPAFEICEADYFLAYKDGEIVGRVAAMINHRANERWNRKLVRFGWLDFIDDMEVSTALINTVEQWGKERGMTEIGGPFGFTDMDREGMLVEGFDRLLSFAPEHGLASHFFFKIEIRTLFKRYGEAGQGPSVVGVDCRRMVGGMDLSIGEAEIDPADVVELQELCQQAVPLQKEGDASLRVVEESESKFL